METVKGWTDRALRRLDEIIVEGERRFKERKSRSDARGVLVGRATSGWQIGRPQLSWVSHRKGSEGGARRFVHGFGTLARALRG